MKKERTNYLLDTKGRLKSPEQHQKQVLISRTMTLNTSSEQKVKRILAAVSLDLKSCDPIVAALRLADQLEADLVLFHAYEFRDYAPAGTKPKQFEHWKASVQKPAMENPENFRARFEAYPRVRTAGLLFQPGYIEDVISSAAKSMDADLV